MCIHLGNASSLSVLASRDGCAIVSKSGFYRGEDSGTPTHESSTFQQYDSHISKREVPIMKAETKQNAKNKIENKVRRALPKSKTLNNSDSWQNRGGGAGSLSSQQNTISSAYTHTH